MVAAIPRPAVPALNLAGTPPASGPGSTRPTRGMRIDREPGARYPAPTCTIPCKVSPGWTRSHAATAQRVPDRQGGGGLPRCLAGDPAQLGPRRQADAPPPSGERVPALSRGRPRTDPTPGRGHGPAGIARARGRRRRGRGPRMMTPEAGNQVDRVPAEAATPSGALAKAPTGIRG